MQVQSQWFTGFVFAAILSCGGFSQAQSWKPALHDADELYDAAEDLHDRAERFRDHQAMQITAELEHLTTDLYQQLKRNACATEVLATLNATGVALEQASLLVSMNCHLRDDRKAQSELANAQRYFGETVEHIQHALQSCSSSRPAYRAPTAVPVPIPVPVPAPSWYQAPTPAPTIVPYGYEVQYRNPAPYGQALPRVRVASVR